MANRPLFISAYILYSMATPAPSPFVLGPEPRLPDFPVPGKSIADFGKLPPVDRLPKPCDCKCITAGGMLLRKSKEKPRHLYHGSSCQEYCRKLQAQAAPLPVPLEVSAAERRRRRFPAKRARPPKPARPHVGPALGH
ncbi:unnamed protein product [Vitrella brassicaformis CCMP3155]|uniref:Uncharacterized protein n=1 Tax=Vitrella brassicaformis (strain CCMP3155) TaxID=1169540 RepID=A0A0G4FB83_VITBC|nr:unnamed protein product [Vitrella brassicaformis CCMP3155]|eukprot:CEM10145.1 unnamed protein product [Vitrella brassicaformis CCMP3155]